MRLQVFVDKSQMGDRGPLTVGDVIEADLRGFPVDYLTFYVPKGTKMLRRTGIFEYLVAGEIKQVDLRPDDAHPGHVWQQILLDCSVPVSILHSGWAALTVDPVGRLGAPTKVTSSSVGEFIGGVIGLQADISYVSPRRLAPGVNAKVIGIEVVRIKAEDVIQQETVRTIDFLSPNGKGALGVNLEIDLERG